MSEYQPRIFPEDVFQVRFSTVADGNMMHGPETDPYEVTERRRRFLGQHGLLLSDAHLLKVTYDTDYFCRYGFASEDTQSFSKKHPYVTPPYDALVHRVPGEAVVVPFADCGIMAALALEKEKGVNGKEPVFMLSHLGRNSLSQKGGRASIEFFTRETGFDISDLLVYVSPAAGRENFPLYDQDGEGIHTVILEQLHDAGLRDDQIEISPLDTTTNKNLYSHSEALKGHQDNGRQIMFAALKERS